MKMRTALIGLAAVLSVSADARTGANVITNYTPVAYALGDTALFDQLVKVKRYSCGERNSFRAKAQARLCPNGQLIGEKIQSRVNSRGCNSTLFLAICATP